MYKESSEIQSLILTTLQVTCIRTVSRDRIYATSGKCIWNQLLEEVNNPIADTIALTIGP